MSCVTLTQFLKKNIDYSSIVDAETPKKEKLISAALDSIATAEQIFKDRADLKILGNERIKVITTCIPFGLKNQFANCWLNSTIQLIRCSKLIKQHPKFLDSSLNIEQILFQIKQVYSDFSLDPNEQQDPFEAIIALFNPNIKWVQITTDLLTQKPSETTIEMPMVQLFPSTNNFDMLVQNYKKTVASDSGKEIVLRLKEPPETLFFQIQRFKQDKSKICYDIENIPRQFDQYEFLGSIIHIGNTIHSGHYVALIKRGENWHYIDDTRVFSFENGSWKFESGLSSHIVPLKGPMELLKQSYILLYQTDAADWEWVLPSGGISNENDSWTYFGYFYSIFFSKKP